MNKLYLVLITSLFLTACGGGSSYSPSSIQTAVSEEIKGDWITDCQTGSDGTSGFTTLTYNTIDDGSEAFFIGIASYATSNCSDEANIIVLAGPVAYSGQETTSICVADKVDQELALITDGEETISGDDFQQFLSDNQLPDTIFDIACVLDDQLLLGLGTDTLDGTTSAKRPIEMNTSVAYDVWVGGPSSRGVVSSGLSLSDGMKRISQRIKNTTEQ